MNEKADTPNLQKRTTVKQAAELWNMSERKMYMARAVMRLRPELWPELEAGRMSMNKAYCIATGKTKPTSYDRLVRAWNNASNDEKMRFLEELSGDPSDNAQP